MNKVMRVIVCSVVFSAPALVSAQGSGGQMGGGPMMNQEQMQRMHQNMAQMQEMMKDMHSADSRDERAKLRQKHMEAMQQHMQMMRGGMMGPGMMNGSGMMGHGQGMMGNGNHPMMKNNQGNKSAQKNGAGRAGGADLSTEQRLEMMESRLNQMQLMMEQMLEHQQSQ